MAGECLQSVIDIIGSQEGVNAISNRGLNLEELQEHIRENLPEDDEVVIFVDFYGSAYTAAKIAGRGAPVISGVNMPMLLSFFTKRDTIPLKELIEVVAADGKRGIKTN